MTLVNRGGSSVLVLANPVTPPKLALGVKCAGGRLDHLALAGSLDGRCPGRSHPSSRPAQLRLSHAATRADRAGFTSEDDSATSALK
jgi:hypothetical protein